MALANDKSSILKAMLGLLLVVVLGFFASKNPMDDSESPAVSNAATDEKTEIMPDIQGRSAIFPATSIKRINSGAEMLSLIAGDQFSLVTEFNGELDTVVLKVFNVSRNPQFTQLQSRGSNGSVSVVTLTPTLTSVLVKTSTNIFEYAGNEFNGVLNQVASLDLSDDAREVKSLARPNKENFQRRKR